jgi:hypothetical protein
MKCVLDTLDPEDDLVFGMMGKNIEEMKVTQSYLDTKETSYNAFRDMIGCMMPGTYVDFIDDRGHEPASPRVELVGRYAEPPGRSAGFEAGEFIFEKEPGEHFSLGHIIAWVKNNRPRYMEVSEGCLNGLSMNGTNQIAEKVHVISPRTEVYWRNSPVPRVAISRIRLV